MKRTLLDQLFYNQDKWRECEKKIAKYDATSNTMSWLNMVILINSFCVSSKHTLVSIVTFCYFVLSLVLMIRITIKNHKLFKKRNVYASKYYECIDELISSKIVEVHDESKH